MLLFAVPNELFPLTYRGPAFELLFQLPQGMRTKTASFLPLPAVAVCYPWTQQAMISFYTAGFFSHARYDVRYCEILCISRNTA